MNEIIKDKIEKIKQTPYYLIIKDELENLKQRKIDIEENIENILEKIAIKELREDEIHKHKS